MTWWQILIDLFGRNVPPPVVVPPVVPPTPTGDIPQQLLDAHNKMRRNNSRASLVIDTRLQAAAQKHADDMNRGNFMSHEGSDGSSVWQRMNRESFQFSSGGENVALGEQTVDEVMTKWKNSAGHRSNILGDFKVCGLARSGDAWCSVFGTER